MINEKQIGIRLLMCLNRITFFQSPFVRDAPWTDSKFTKIIILRNTTDTGKLFLCTRFLDNNHKSEALKLKLLTVLSWEWDDNKYEDNDNLIFNWHLR